MRLYYLTKLFISLLRVMRDPTRTTDVIRVADCLRDLRLLDGAVKRVQETPEGRNTVQKRIRIQIPPFELLGKMPEGTLGRAYFQHMTSNGLSPDFYAHLKIEDDCSFMMMHMRDTHDLWHTLTGFGTTVPDEIALLAFMMAQVRTPYSALLIAGGLLRAAFKDHALLFAIMEAIGRGWRMGCDAKPLFALDWGANWETPLEELRSRYAVVA